jgi:integrase
MSKNGNKKEKTIVIDDVCRIRFVPKFNRYEVDAGLKLGGTSKHRKQFKKKSDALVYADQLKDRLKNEGLSGFKLSREQLMDAEKGLKLLKGSASLEEACKFYLQFNSLKKPNMLVSELVDEFIEFKEKQSALGERGASQSTLQDYKYRLGTLKDHFGSVKILSFKEDDFLDWLLDRKTDTRGLMRTSKALFSYATDKNYLPDTPLKRKIPKVKTSKPSVLEDNKWRSLILHAIATQDHRNTSRGQPIDLLANVVLGLWCGLRPEAELRRLDWTDVNIDEGFVNVHDDWKVAIGRHVTIPDCAKPLLRLCKNKKGPVVNQKNFRRRWEWLRKSAEVFDTWDNDIMRHTFASMHYGFYGDKQKIINELGHCNSSMLRHYVNHGAKMKKRSQEFFSFTAPLPDSEELEISSA